MTFNPDADVSDNNVQRRGRGGRTAAIAGGGVVGVGAIVVLLISAFTGVDLSGLLGGGTDPGSQSQPQSTGSSEGTVANCSTGKDANSSVDCRVAATSLVLNQLLDRQHVKGYIAPKQVSVDGATSTPCGTASNDVGPFYCPLRSDRLHRPHVLRPAASAVRRRGRRPRPGLRRRARVRPPHPEHHRHDGHATRTTAPGRRATGCAPNCRPTATRARSSPTWRRRRTRTATPYMTTADARRRSRTR